MAKFKPGDVVRLPSDSQLFTVSDVEGDLVFVAWMKEGVIMNSKQPAAMFIAAEAPPPGPSPSQGRFP